MVTSPLKYIRLVTFLATALCMYGAMPSESAESLLKSLQQADEAFFDAPMTLEFSMRQPDTPADINFVREKHPGWLNGIVTRAEDDSWGCLLMLDPETPPPVVVKENVTLVQVRGDNLSRITVRGALSEPRFSVSFTTSRQYSAASGQSRQESTSSDMSAVKGPLFHHEMAVAILCTGRGFSRCIETIDFVEAVEGGNLLRCYGKLFTPGQNPNSPSAKPCPFVAEIDPALNYLIRTATLCVDEEGCESISMNNYGTIEGPAGAFPEQASYIRHSRGRGLNSVHDVKYHAVHDYEDTVIFRYLREVIRPERIRTYLW